MNNHDKLTSLIQDITDTYEASLRACKLTRKNAATALTEARLCGEKLNEAKALCAHGEWLQWLSDHTQISERTAQNYMRLASSNLIADKNGVLELNDIYKIIGIKKEQAQKPNTKPVSDLDHVNGDRISQLPAGAGAIEVDENGIPIGPILLPVGDSCFGPVTATEIKAIEQDEADCVANRQAECSQKDKLQELPIPALPIGELDEFGIPIGGQPKVITDTQPAIASTTMTHIQRFAEAWYVVKPYLADTANLSWVEMDGLNQVLAEIRELLQ